MTDSFLAAFRARDEAYTRLADIKTIPATDNEVQFKFPDGMFDFVLSKWHT